MVGFAKSQAVTGAAERMRRLRARQRDPQDTYPPEPDSYDPQQPAYPGEISDDRVDDSDEGEPRNGVTVVTVKQQPNRSLLLHLLLLLILFLILILILGRGGMVGGVSQPDDAAASLPDRMKHRHPLKKNHHKIPPEPSAEVFTACDEYFGPVTPQVAKALG